MSREIKFRAWHKKAKEYRVIETIDFDYIKQKGRADCITTRDNNTLHDPWDDVIEEVELEQYTGLKDKNGKEIYEGDIVTVMGYGTYEVFWREWDSSFSLKPIDTVKEKTRILILCGDWEGDYEVIGNIHENPELLGGQNETKT